MKNIILLIFLVSNTLFSFSQVDVNSLNDNEKKILNTFKEQYVEKNFKDPYSFQLLKLESKPKTCEDWLLDDLNFLKGLLEKKDFTSYKKNELIEKIKLKEDEYSGMTDEIRKTIKTYEVRLDCYGTNSYGNKVLGRYKFNYVMVDKDFKPVDYSVNKLYISEIK
jgi:hypothetical protein